MGHCIDLADLQCNTFVFLSKLQKVGNTKIL